MPADAYNNDGAAGERNVRAFLNMAPPGRAGAGRIEHCLYRIGQAAPFTPRHGIAVKDAAAKAAAGFAAQYATTRSGDRFPGFHEESNDPY